MAGFLKQRYDRVLKELEWSTALDSNNLSCLDIRRNTKDPVKDAAVWSLSCEQVMN